MNSNEKICSSPTLKKPISHYATIMLGCNQLAMISSMSELNVNIREEFTGGGGGSWGAFNINLVTRYFRNLLFGDGDYTVDS